MREGWKHQCLPDWHRRLSFAAEIECCHFGWQAQRILFSPNAAEEPYLPYANWDSLEVNFRTPILSLLTTKCKKPRGIRGFLHFMRKYMQSDKILFFQIDL